MNKTGVSWCRKNKYLQKNRIKKIGECLKGVIKTTFGACHFYLSELKSTLHSYFYFNSIHFHVYKSQQSEFPEGERKCILFSAWFGQVWPSLCSWGCLQQLRTLWISATVGQTCHLKYFYSSITPVCHLSATVCSVCGASYWVVGPAVGNLRSSSVPENTVLHALHTWVFPQVPKRGLVLFHLCSEDTQVKCCKTENQAVNSSN